MDVNLGRDPHGGPCRVYSKRLHLSYQCSETFNKSHFLPFLGIDKDHNRRPSYFAFNCSGIPEVSEDVPHNTELRSPLEIVSHKTDCDRRCSRRGRHRRRPGRHHRRLGRSKSEEVQVVEPGCNSRRRPARPWPR
ncbi:uncharacterized protein [Penaeus vannamei]|uniref:uncharacterized protein isoform X2 n=1 Tax=Penaeus vannamei TaxID=6689 RepID=UPI00387F3E92